MKYLYAMLIGGTASVLFGMYLESSPVLLRFILGGLVGLVIYYMLGKRKEDE